MRRGDPGAFADCSDKPTPGGLKRCPPAKLAHLDVSVKDPEGNECLLAPGGSRLGEPQIYEGHWSQVMQDPEGNEFCIAKEWGAGLPLIRKQQPA